MPGYITQDIMRGNRQFLGELLGPANLRPELLTVEIIRVLHQQTAAGVTLFRSHRQRLATSQLLSRMWRQLACGVDDYIRSPPENQHLA